MVIFCFICFILFFLSIANCKFCVPFNTQCLTSSYVKLLLSEQSEYELTLLINSDRRQSHHIQMVIRHLVKQYHLIPQFLHPQYTQTQTVQQLKQNIKILTQSYHVARCHSFIFSRNCFGFEFEHHYHTDMRGIIRNFVFGRTSK